jgi:hypothetical protein
MAGLESNLQLASITTQHKISAPGQARHDAPTLGVTVPRRRPHRCDIWRRWRAEDELDTDHGRYLMLSDCLVARRAMLSDLRRPHPLFLPAKQGAHDDSNRRGRSSQAEKIWE